MLKFANPWIRYRPPESTELIPGVAIALKAFIKSMDDYDLPHLTEKAVRRQLRADRRCTTHSHQRFLPATVHPHTPIVRVQASDMSSQKGCVCIPKSFVPVVFYQLLEEGITMQVCTVYLYII